MGETVPCIDLLLSDPYRTSLEIGDYLQDADPSDRYLTSPESTACLEIAAEPDTKEGGIKAVGKVTRGIGP